MQILTLCARIPSCSVICLFVVALESHFEQDYCVYICSFSQMPVVAHILLHVQTFYARQDVPQKKLDTHIVCKDTFMLSDMSFFSCSRVTFRARLSCVYLQFLTDTCSCSHSPPCTDFLCSARCSFYVNRYSHSVQGYLTSLIVFCHFVIAAKS